MKQKKELEPAVVQEAEENADMGADNAALIWRRG